MNYSVVAIVLCVFFPAVCFVGSFSFCLLLLFFALLFLLPARFSAFAAAVDDEDEKNHNQQHQDTYMRDRERAPRPYRHRNL